MSDKLFYSPAALDGAAVFITAFMGALDINCEVVDVVSKKSVGGEDLKTLNPLETVPFVITSDGLLLSEQQVILDYLVDKVPKKLAAQGRGTQYYQMKQAIGYISQNLIPSLELLSRPDLDASNAAFFQALVIRTLGVLEDYFLGRKSFLAGNGLTVADVVLYTALNATATIGIELERWPRLKQYFDRMDINETIQEAQTRMLSNPQSVLPPPPQKQKKWIW